MAESNLLEQQRALHRRAEDILARAYGNAELMEMVRRSFEGIARGERSIPLREIQALEREQPAER